MIALPSSLSSCRNLSTYLIAEYRFFYSVGLPGTHTKCTLKTLITYIAY